MEEIKLNLEKCIKNLNIFAVNLGEYRFSFSSSCAVCFNRKIVWISRLGPSFLALCCLICFETLSWVELHVSIVLHADVGL